MEKKALIFAQCAHPSICPPFPPKYQFGPTLTRNVTMRPQVWARLVDPRQPAFCIVAKYWEITYLANEIPILIPGKLVIR